MWGLPIQLIVKIMKLKIYPAIIVALFVASTGVWLGRINFSLWSGSTNPPDSPNSATILPSVPSPLSVTPLPPAIASPVSTEQPQKEKLAANTKESSSNPKAIGSLRVSNRTEHPVRVALLLRKSTQKSSAKPAHWDFAPGEGGGKGLLLSLPEGKLQLKPEDILVVFAQDGSRLYWGPYVVGETAAPVWNNRVTEWQLILQP